MSRIFGNIAQIGYVVRDIDAAMDGNICRCGTYQRIVRAIERAAREA